MRIALAGNPNSGKTTVFNALTGLNEKVGNWAGVTVDKKEHSVKKAFCQNNEITVVDLPGAYSMSPFTSEESVTSSFIKRDGPDVIINIVDATNLSRSLFFTTQLLELGIPVVIALNKTDLNKKRETVIDTGVMSELLNCPVIETVSSAKSGMSELISEAISVAGKKQIAPYTEQVSDYTDRDEVKSADVLRYGFVDSVVSAVEKRKKRSNEVNY